MGDAKRLSGMVIDRAGLVVPVRRDPSGVRGPTKAQAAGPHWRRTSQGYYVPSPVDATVVEQRIVEAAVLVVRYGGVTGWASLRWLGGYWFHGKGPDGVTDRPVPLAIASDDIRPQPGVSLSAERLDPREVRRVDGLPLTDPVRSACFEARYAADVRQAVEILDMAAYSDLVSAAEAAELASHLQGWTGVPQLRAALPLVDENSWSPQETRTRLVWLLDAELPPLLSNRPVFDRRGHHLATPDLLDEEAGLAIEYESDLHLEGRRRRSDRDREEILRRHGLEVLTVLAGDASDPWRLSARFRRARQRSRFAAAGERGWTIDPPSWWIPTDSVGQRRNLDQRQRDRLLRHRLKVG